MKKVFAAVAFILLLSCGNEGNSHKTSDTATNAASGGANSDGINTIGTDTAHMDTSAGNIKK